MGKYGCGQLKPLDEFCLKKAKNGKHYPNSYCNKCNSKAAGQYQKDHSKEKSEYNKNYFELNKTKHKIQSRNWYQNNKESIKARSKLRYETNKEQIFKHDKERYDTEPQYKIALNLRRRLHGALKGKWKVGSFVRDLGCSIEQFMHNLEMLFYTNPTTHEPMSWGNYGKWHLDHVIPLDSFDLEDPEQFKKACYYTNLQPLWAEHNLAKGNKILTKEEIEQLKTT